MTDLRGPHRIKHGERYAYRNQGDGEWKILQNPGLGERYASEKGLYRLLTPDEIRMLQSGDVVVNTATGDECKVTEDRCIIMGLYVLKVDGLAISHLSLALLSLASRNPTALEQVRKARAAYDCSLNTSQLVLDALEAAEKALTEQEDADA